MEQETNEQCRLMQEDYLQFVKQISSRGSRYPPVLSYLNMNHGTIPNVPRKEEKEAILSLESAVHTASNYLRQCGTGPDSRK